MCTVFVYTHTVRLSSLMHTCMHMHDVCKQCTPFYVYMALLRVLFTHQCLFFFRSIGTLRDGSAVLLTHPAKVTHWLHDHHMREELPPQRSEGGVAHRAHRLSARSLLVELPHLMFRGAAKEELNIRAFVPGDTARKDHCIRL